MILSLAFAYLILFSATLIIELSRITTGFPDFPIQYLPYYSGILLGSVVFIASLKLYSILIQWNQQRKTWDALLCHVNDLPTLLASPSIWKILPKRHSKIGVIFWNEHFPRILPHNLLVMGSILQLSQLIDLYCISNLWIFQPPTDPIITSMVIQTCYQQNVSVQWINHPSTPQYKKNSQENNYMLAYQTLRATQGTPWINHRYMNN